MLNSTFIKGNKKGLIFIGGILLFILFLQIAEKKPKCYSRDYALKKVFQGIVTHKGKDKNNHMSPTIYIDGARLSFYHEDLYKNIVIGDSIKKPLNTLNVEIKHKGKTHFILLDYSDCDEDY